MPNSRIATFIFLFLALCLQASKLAAGNDAVTYTKDIAPILRQNCVCCHHPGDIAPFSLMNYAEAKRHCEEIAAVTRSRFMPPWKAVPAFGNIRSSRQLDERDIELIQRWAADGAPEGGSPLPPQPEFHDTWRLGPPDLVVSMPEAYTLEVEGEDVYQCFVVPLNLR